MRSFAYLMLAAGALVAAQNLTIEITYAVECTAKSKIGDTIDVLYNGTFTNGTLFDSSSWSPNPVARGRYADCGRLRREGRAKPF